jgi:hypothetical protein
MTDLAILGIFVACALAFAGYVWLCERVGR